MEISGQLHTLTTLSMGKKSSTHWIGCWMDLMSLSGNFGTERYPAPAEIQPWFIQSIAKSLYILCYPSSYLYTCNLSKITDLKAANILFTDEGETFTNLTASIKAYTWHICFVHFIFLSLTQFIFDGTHPVTQAQLTAVTNMSQCSCE